MGKEKAVRTDPGGTMPCLFRTWHAPHAGSESDLTACYLLGVPRPTVRTLSQFQAVSSSVKIYFGCRGWIRTSGLSGYEPNGLLLSHPAVLVVGGPEWL